LARIITMAMIIFICIVGVSIWSSIHDGTMIGTVDAMYLDRSQIPKDLYEITMRCVAKTNVPAWLVLSIMKHESHFGELETGNSGEIGEMQILPCTGRAYGYTVKELRQRDKNIECGVRILAADLDKYSGHISDVIAAYNRGRAIVRNGKYVNQKYVDKVYLSLNEIRRR
jgi:soluble lytic murein transglycosylase-like protein